MLGLFRRRGSDDTIARLHTSIIAASREPALYGEGAIPDTIEGRFESLAVHVLVVLRRLRRLPDPAADVGQDLVDRVFAHLEIALRELGVGDFGVPKRMKKIAGAFYDRTRLYDPYLDRRDAEGLAGEIAAHLDVEPHRLRCLADHALRSEVVLEKVDLPAILKDISFAERSEPAS